MPYMTSEYVALKAPEGTEERIPGKPDRYEYHNPGIDVLLCSKAFFDNNQQAWLQYADFLFALNLEKGLILKKCEINHYFEFEARVVYERKDPDLKSALNQVSCNILSLSTISSWQNSMHIRAVSRDQRLNLETQSANQIVPTLLQP